MSDSGGASVDDADSGGSLDISDVSDTASNHSESEGSEDTDHNDNEDQLPDISGPDWVSESVFLDGTESAINGKDKSV